MEAVSSSETSVCFHLSTQRHEQRTCNLHFRYCLYVQKLLTKNYFANFRKFCGYVMNFIVTPCILIHCILRTSYILLLAVNGQRRLPETCRVVIPTKLEFSASVGFIHKESVTMHGHTIVKYKAKCTMYSFFTSTSSLNLPEGNQGLKETKKLELWFATKQVTKKNFTSNQCIRSY